MLNFNVHNNNLFLSLWWLLSFTLHILIVSNNFLMKKSSFSPQKNHHQLKNHRRWEIFSNSTSLVTGLMCKESISYSFLRNFSVVLDDGKFYKNQNKIIEEKQKILLIQFLLFLLFSPSPQKLGYFSPHLKNF